MKGIGILKTWILVPIIATAVLISCTTESSSEPTDTAVQVTQTSTETVSETADPTASSEQDEDLSGLVDFSDRTPVPTTTPSQIEGAIEGFAESVGIEEFEFLGLLAADWLNIGVSLLLVLAGMVVARVVIDIVLGRLTKRTETEIDDQLLKKSKQQLNWLIIAFFIEFAILRLQFLDPIFKERVRDLFFIIYAGIFLVVVWRLIGLVLEQLRERLMMTMDTNQAESLVTLAAWFIRVIVLLIFITILLDHFGISITAMTAALGIGGLAISLAAQDTIADAIAGILILVDQPFRIGDRIEIQEIDTWGDVVEIGLRTTRIRTRDNRLVIVPNSKIGSGTVVNYTYPDPNYRIQIEIGIGYGQDIDRIREVIVKAVSQVEGVNPNRPVEALFLEFAPSDMTFRVRWWIESYIDTRRMFDKVNQAMYQALETEGIDMPFTTYDVNIQVDSEGRDQPSRTLGSSEDKE